MLNNNNLNTNYDSLNNISISINNPNIINTLLKKIYKNRKILIRNILLIINLAASIVYFYLASYFYGQFKLSNYNNILFDIYCITLPIYFSIIRNIYIYLTTYNKTLCSGFYCILSHIILESLFLIIGIYEVYYVLKKDNIYFLIKNTNIYKFINYSIYLQSINELVLLIILLIIIFNILKN